MYNCPNDYGNGGHYVRPGQYWEDTFTSNGRTVNSGFLELGAAYDGGDHRATVGVWADPALSRPITTTTVNVAGYGGVSFTLAPAAVTPGVTYYVGVRAIGDLTAYDRIDSNCFIGQISGLS